MTSCIDGTVLLPRFCHACSLNLKDQGTYANRIRTCRPCIRAPCVYVDGYRIRWDKRRLCYIPFEPNGQLPTHLQQPEPQAINVPQPPEPEPDAPAVPVHDGNPADEEVVAEALAEAIMPQPQERPRYPEQQQLQAAAHVLMA